jgi:valyl-tRNA synthetase
LRFTLAAMASPGRNINLAESRLESSRNFATKLWNAARYAEMNGCALAPAYDPRSAKLTVNRWIAGATRSCAAEATAALEAFRFDEAAHQLYHFVWGTFCDWYLEFSKPILQGGEDAARAETRQTTGWVLAQILRLMHPIMPFISEELRRELGGAGMLMVEPWPDLAPELHDPAAAAEMDWVVEAIAAIRAIRAEMNVPPAAKVPLLVKDAEPEITARLDRHRDHFRGLARVEDITLSETVPSGSVPAIVPGATLILRLGEVVDLAKEKARLGKEIGRLDADLAKFAAKLANPAFLSKAKPEVIDEQREREGDARRDRDRLQAAYERLDAV